MRTKTKTASLILAAAALLAFLATGASAARRTKAVPTHKLSYQLPVYLTDFSACSGSQTLLSDLVAVELWGFPTYAADTLGSPRLIYTDNSPGAPGSFDTLSVDDGFRYYLLAIRAGGMPSCASEIVLVPPTQTGVETEATPDRVMSRRLFDVQGRLVLKPAASGVYFQRKWWRSGRVETKRIVVLK